MKKIFLVTSLATFAFAGETTFGDIMLWIFIGVPIVIVLLKFAVNGIFLLWEELWDRLFEDDTARSIRKISARINRKQNRKNTLILILWILFLIFVVLKIFS